MGKVKPVFLYPMKMRPCYKEYLWGGKCLKSEYGKSEAPEVTAESWELASHADGVCCVADGPLQGKTLVELGALDKDVFWGKKCTDAAFPILVKLIDAEKDLSIQVHPSDETALWDCGEQGKAEMWYIADCKPKSSIYFGFSQQVTKEEVLRRAKDGTIGQVLNRVPVSKGDVFYILPGTIHAIGAGIVIAEIQQNSNTTFRVYDYQRKGADGKLRPLHLERAAEVLDLRPILPEECKLNSGAAWPDFTLTQMFSCECFQAHRIDVHSCASLRCDGESFHHILCVEGKGHIYTNEISCPLEKGDSYFLPAALGDYEIRGACRVLLSRV